MTTSGSVGTVTLAPVAGSRLRRGVGQFFLLAEGVLGQQPTATPVRGVSARSNVAVAAIASVACSLFAGCGRTTSPPGAGSDGGGLSDLDAVPADIAPNPTAAAADDGVAGADGDAAGHELADVADAAAAGDAGKVDVDAAPDATNAFPGALWLASPLGVTITMLLTDKEGCDWDDDGVPNNVTGKIVGLYPSLNDTMTAINEFTYAWLPSTSIAPLPEGATFTASSHAATVDASGALWLAGAGVMPSGSGVLPKHLLSGQKAGEGAFELAWAAAPGEAAWSFEFVSATGDGGLTTVSLGVRAVRIQALQQPGGYGGMICAALDFGALGAPGALLKPDLDLNGDGTLESSSAALMFVASPAPVAGISW